jgi:hypothetical protein
LLIENSSTSALSAGRKEKGKTTEAIFPDKKSEYKLLKEEEIQAKSKEKTLESNILPSTL